MDLNSIASLKDVPVVIAILAFGYLIVRVVADVFKKGLELNRESARERSAIDQRRNEIDARRIESDENNAKILESVAKQLGAVGGTVTELKDTVTEKNNVVVKKLDTLSEDEKDRDTKMREWQGDQYKNLKDQLDVITTSLEKVVDCTKELPKVAEETQKIFKLIDELKKELATKDEEKK